MNENNNEINYYTAEQIAFNLGIGVSSVDKLINRYIEDLAPYMKRIHMKRKKQNRPVRCLNEHGVALMLTLKNSGAKKKLNATVAYENKTKEFKKAVVEKAVSNNQPELLNIPEAKTELDVYRNDPIIAMRMDQMEMQKKISVIESKIEAIEQTKLSLCNTPIRYENRQKLSGWVRCIAIELNKPFKSVWASVHLSVGKCKVDYYSEADFLVAKELLKNHFEFYKIEFND